MAIQLERHQLFNLYCAELRNSTNIISSQIYQHDVFGNFFRVLAQFRCKLLVVLIIQTALASAGNGPTCNFAIAQLHHWLWRTANNGDAVVLHVIHVWAWVNLSQHPIEIEWVGT